YTVWVYPPPEQPYLVLRQELEWPQGAPRHQVELTAPRGILVRGTVEEEGTGRRVAGAEGRYEQRRRNNPVYDASGERRRHGMEWQTGDARTNADGTFYIAVPPGPGTLLVKAAEPDFLHAETSANHLDGIGPGGRAYFPDAIVPLSPLPGGGVEHPT